MRKRDSQREREVLLTIKEWLEGRKSERKRERKEREREGEEEGQKSLSFTNPVAGRQILDELWFRVKGLDSGQNDPLWPAPHGLMESRALSAREQARNENLRLR